MLHDFWNQNTQPVIREGLFVACMHVILSWQTLTYTKHDRDVVVRRTLGWGMALRLHRPDHRPLA